MRILYDFSDGPRVCPYLPQKQAVLDYQLVQGLVQSDYEAMMQINFRKFGQLLFRPNCPDCRACQSLRVPLASFKMDRSMRRNLANNNDLRMQITRAITSDQRIGLYNRYHQSQAHDKNWLASKINENEYQAHFLDSETEIEELAVFRKEQLIGLLIFEELVESISFIYHYYDPDLKKRGLGTFLILKALQLAKKRDKKFAYLGYFVADSQSMRYKARFLPNQILVNGSWC